jgi:hypothetical protein
VNPDPDVKVVVNVGVNVVNTCDVAIRSRWLSYGALTNKYVPFGSTLMPVISPDRVYPASGID